MFTPLLCRHHRLRENCRASAAHAASACVPAGGCQLRCSLPHHQSHCFAGTLNCVEAAEIALRILHQLVRLQAAVDAQGNPLQPLPIVHRTLASPQCLPHIAQARSHLCSNRMQNAARCVLGMVLSMGAVDAPSRCTTLRFIAEYLECSLLAAFWASCDVQERQQCRAALPAVAGSALSKHSLEGSLDRLSMHALYIAWGCHCIFC